MEPSIAWKELTAEVLRGKASDDAIVILPVASMEQHGPHLPVGVDTYLCEAVCLKGAKLAATDVPVVVAPTLWCGMAEHHMPSGGTFTFDIPTYQAVLRALLGSLARHGFRKVLIVNGHGGNIAALNAFLPDFARDFALKLYATTYFDLSRADLAGFLEDQTTVRHACEVETSMMMVVKPETVRRERLAEAFGALDADPRGKFRAARFHAFNELTPTGVAGDARRADPDKGEKLLAACAEGLAATLRDAVMWA